MCPGSGRMMQFTMAAYSKNFTPEDAMNITRRELIKGLPALLVSGAVLSAPSAAPASGPAYVLNQFSVAGFQHYDGPELLGVMKPGDNLQLRVETKSPCGESAVRILWNHRMVGYVPRSDNRHISRLLQQGAPVTGRIIQICPQAPAWKQLKVEVGLGG